MNTLTKRLASIALILSSIALSACNSEGHYYYEDNHDDHHHHDDTVVITDPPALSQFHIIDTYGTNTEFDYNTELAFSPYINQGYFEVFWQAHAWDDYYVELRVNDIPSTDGSRLITSEYCGPYSYCHDHQYQYCEYTSGFDIFCESSSGDLQSQYVGDMIATIPDDLHLILQVCDASFFYCEYQTHRVSFE